ncbi:MAG: hypothetical protein H7A51_14125 [Akkermansiaceae bacterium]|nr:hypothetical protein [Akkermansiaceae bacterium]
MDTRAALSHRRICPGFTLWLAMLVSGLTVGWQGIAVAKDLSSANSIQQDIDALKSEVKTLPELQLTPTPWTLGYRSAFGKPRDHPLQIDLKFVAPASIDLLALLPTSYTSDTGEVAAFGFPVRFTIERIRADGSSETIVDYSQQDYTVTGIEPQLFHLAEPVLADGIRLTVLRHAENPTWWDTRYVTTLSEIFVFSGARNVALGSKVTTSSSNPFGYVWHPDCLVDGFSLFSPIKQNLQNPFDNFYHMADSLAILIDLGEQRTIDELRIWPVVHSAQHNFPLSSGIGFPTRIRLEQLDTPRSAKGKLIYETGNNFPKPASSPLMLRLANAEGRYFRLSVQNPVLDFRIENRARIALSEIEFLADGVTLPARFAIRNKRTRVGLTRLSDGLTTEGTIIPLREWAEALTHRAALDRRLAILQQDLVFAQRQERERLQFFIVIAIIIIITLVILVWLIKLLADRRWSRVRDRIARDLHDEIGANASSLVHMTELIQETIQQPTDLQNQMFEDTLHTARVTSRETRNFVRFLESDKASFEVEPQIRKVAQQILGGIQYNCTLEVGKLAKQLSAAEQWDLLMFVKEALNNIAKHAEASHVDILTRRHAGRIEIHIDDNGKGMPQGSPPPHHLEIRAERLKGELNVESDPETGTRVLLKLKK